MSAALPGLDALLAAPRLADILTGRRAGILVLDYDGTLAPFMPQRSEARPYAGVVDCLRALPARGAGRFVIVTGRPAGDIPPFLAPAVPSEIWGCHGAERLRPGELARIPGLSPALGAALDQAEAIAGQYVPCGALERKPVSLAVHWRGQGASEVTAVRETVVPAWEALAANAGLDVLPFDGGLELRLPGLTKRLAVEALHREAPQTSLVYCGDDLTDEDALTALGPPDVGVLVRGEPRPSAAGFHIRPPQELVQLLSVWAEAHRRVSA